MIDIYEEKILSLAGAAKSLPPVDGKHLNPSTIYRWIADGIGGVKLDSVKIGRRLCTSKEALQNFVNQLQEAPTPQSKPRTTAPTKRTAKQRERDIRRANDRLAKRGLIEAEG